MNALAQAKVSDPVWLVLLAPPNRRVDGFRWPPVLLASLGRVDGFRWPPVLLTSLGRVDGFVGHPLAVAMSKSKEARSCADGPRRACGDLSCPTVGSDTFTCTCGGQVLEASRLGSKPRRRTVNAVVQVKVPAPGFASAGDSERGCASEVSDPGLLMPDSGQAPSLALVAGRGLKPPNCRSQTLHLGADTFTCTSAFTCPNPKASSCWPTIRRMCRVTSLGRVRHLHLRKGVHRPPAERLQAVCLPRRFADFVPDRGVRHHHLHLWRAKCRTEVRREPSAAERPSLALVLGWGQ